MKTVVLIALIFNTLLFSNTLMREGAQRIDQLDDIYNYDVISYDIYLNLTDTTSHHVNGISTMEIVTETEIDTIIFDLVDELETISIDIKDGESSLPYDRVERVNDRALVIMGETISSNKELSLVISYDGESPTGSYFNRSFEVGTHNGATIIYSLSAPQGARYWMACKDIPRDKATIAFTIKMWSNHDSFANGLLVSDTPIDGGCKEQRWESNYQTSTYLMAIAVSNYDIFTIDYTSNISGKSFPIECYVYPEKLEQAENDFAEIVDMLDCYETYYGEYPFSDEKYGMANFPWGGGMENQTATHLGASVVTGTGAYSDLIAHELAHQWIGDNVTGDTWDDIWFTEGGATFSEAIWNEFKDGEYGYRTTMDSFESGAKNHHDNLWGFDDTYNRFVYDRGAWTYHMLRYYVGLKSSDDTFFSTFRKLLQNSSSTKATVTTDQFINFFNSEAGVDLTQFGEDWIYGESYPNYEVTYNLSNGDNSAELEVILDQTNSEVQLFRTPIPFVVQFTDFTDSLIYIEPTSYSNSYIYNFDKRVHNNLSLENFNYGNKILCNKSLNPGKIVEVEDEICEIYPNPFNPVTNIRFALNSRSDVEIRVFNRVGEKVYESSREDLSIGIHSEVFDGSSLASGVYFYSIKSNNSLMNGKMILIK